MRIKLTVAYDGTDFRGWAANPGQRTVQSTLTEAVRQVSGEKVEIIGASRTDSGAHAKGQVCHFDTTRPIRNEMWVIALNRMLPVDLKVIQATNPGENFNSRFMAIDRHYRYRIQTSPSDPLRGRYVHEYGRKLNIPLMQKASQLLLGTHDFLAFTEEIPFSGTNTVRKLFRFDVREVRDEVWVDVVGTAFLRGMMRRMSGALLEVGRGYRSVEEVSRLLQREERHNLQWPVVLPAKGLCLQKIRYGRNPRDIRSTALSNEIDLEEQ